MFVLFHTDTVNIYRVAQTTDGYGGVVEQYEAVGTCKGRLSMENIEATLNNANRTSTQRFKLFTAVDVDIKQNDKLEILRHGNSEYKYVFYAGAPFKYFDFIPHQEIVLSEAVENGL